ncbi:hypothetical protein [Vagococcus bubulae]|uniref:hypothetical protein n=1 Tax=Vagococcus bubulae TaxID=1977868 RepID=UPI0022E13DF3|nr:hypothetical protein [Vagococcus bubulae]
MTEENVYKQAYNAIRDMAKEGMEGDGRIKSYFDEMDDIIQQAEVSDKSQKTDTQEEANLSRGAEFAKQQNERDQQQRDLKSIWGE